MFAKFGLILCLLLTASSVSAGFSETECRKNILNQLNSMIAQMDTSKADDAIVDMAQGATKLEVYDNYINFNSDFKADNGEDLSGQVYRQAMVRISEPEGVIDNGSIVEGNSATVKFILTGACCYFFNPCIGIKLGFKARLTGDAIKDKDDSVVSASYAKGMAGTLTGVINAKIAKANAAVSLTSSQ